MPIQVVATYKKIPPPPVDLVTAGEDVFPLCDLEIFLQAIVDPLPNIQGHTILWEQIEGTPVILSSTDTLNTSYLQIPNDETDKHFRITIDKDLPEEQSDVVIVYATPTSLIQGSISKNDTSHYTPSDPVPCDSIVVTTSAIVPIPTPVRDDDVAVTEVFDVSWDLPEDPLLQPFIEEMILYENGTPVATYLPTDTLTYSGGPELYNILTNFLVNGHPSSADSCVKDFTAVAVPSVRVIDDLIDSVGFSAPEVTFKSFPNLVQSAQDIQNTDFSVAESIVARFINSYQNVVESQASGFKTGTTIIERTDPGGIGGG